MPMKIGWCPKKYADLIMVDSKQYWVKTPQSVLSPASGGRNSSAAYFLGHYLKIVNTGSKVSGCLNPRRRRQKPFHQIQPIAVVIKR